MLTFLTLWTAPRKSDLPLNRNSEVFHGNERLLLNTENLGKESTTEKDTKENEVVIAAFLIHSK